MDNRIKERYALINKKTSFIKKAAQELGKSPSTIRNHWVGGFWMVPENSQSKFLELIEEELTMQPRLKEKV